VDKRDMVLAQSDGSAEKLPETRQMRKEAALEILRSKINTTKLSSKDLEELREALKVVPAVARTVGNLVVQARERIIEGMSTNDVVKESIRQRVIEVQEELGYTEAPLVEQLLIEQVGICWLQLYEVEMRYVSARSSDRLSIDQAAWLERRLTMVKNRYTKAIETLARVRKMGRVTPLQVNIAGQQVNLVKRD
jgi:hypothetical protein